MSSVTSDRINGLTTSAARKAPVACATTANITLSGEQTIDGQTTNESRVLVKDQDDTTENGLYDSSSGAWTRCKDFDGSRDVVTGTDVFVTSGTENGGEYWYVSTTGDPDPGDAMVFTQATLNAPAAGTLTAANNLSDVASASTAFSNIKQAATTSASGVVELATTAEADAGTSTTLAVTPAGLASAIAASGTFTVNGLTAITTLQGADKLAVADNSDSDGNKKITFANFKTQLVTDLLKDEDDMASDSASHGATQQSVKAYTASETAKFQAQLLHIQDQKTSGTNGGSFTSGSWQTRDLNTVVTNEISGASLASNQITLGAGTYYIEAFAPANSVLRHKAKLYDTTNTADVLFGISSYNDYASSDKNQGYSVVSGRFTLSGSVALEIQHRCEATDSTGYGVASSFGTEIYTDVKIWKVG